MITAAVQHSPILAVSNPTLRWEKSSQIHCSSVAKALDIFFTVIKVLIAAIFIPIGLWLYEYSMQFTSPNGRAGLVSEGPAWATAGVIVTACSIVGTVYLARWGTQRIVGIVTNTLFPYDHLDTEVVRETVNHLATAKLGLICREYGHKLPELERLGVLIPATHQGIKPYVQEKYKLKKLKKQVQSEQSFGIDERIQALEVLWKSYQSWELTRTLPFKCDELSTVLALDEIDADYRLSGDETNELLVDV